MTEKQVDGSGSELLKTLGGPVGILESAVPGTAYVTVFSLTLDVLFSLIVAGSIAIMFAVFQVFRKKPLTQVFAGLVGLAISVYLPLRDGLNNVHAIDYFVPGILTNLAYLTAIVLSLLIRQPLLGFAISFFAGNTKTWRKDKAIFKRYFWITIMWASMFGFRLLIQVPLYFSNQLTGLGIAKVALGTPLYALVIWFTWLSAKITFAKPK